MKYSNTNSSFTDILFSEDSLSFLKGLIFSKDLVLWKGLAFYKGLSFGKGMTFRRDLISMRKLTFVKGLALGKDSSQGFSSVFHWIRKHSVLFHLYASTPKREKFEKVSMFAPKLIKIKMV